MSTEETVRRDRRGYGRGLVLGLTMAELMLLLVFCLLLYAATLFVRHDREQEAMAERLEAAEARLDEERALAEAREALLERTIRSAGGEAPPPDWRTLVRARAVVERMEREGVDAERLARRAPEMATLVEALDEGATARDLVTALDESRRWRDAARETGEVELSPEDVVALARERRDLVAQLEAARAELARAGAGRGDGEHDWPPIISLTDAAGFSFATGQATIEGAFADRLRGSIAAVVAETVERYDADVVEVIGHTDEQPMAPRPSNLDRTLGPALAGREAVADLAPGDNAGLGMARAVTVARLLGADPRLAGVTILPLSGAQLIVPGDRLSDGSEARATPSAERRRIEIRVRRSERAADLAETSPAR